MIGTPTPRGTTRGTPAQREPAISGRLGQAPRYWKRIGPRLLAGFLLLIVPTLLIGIVAVQRFATLTATTTELSQRDLPEIVVVDRLRTLLFQQLDAEQQVSAGDRSVRAALVTQLAAQRDALRALEPPDTTDARANDTALVHVLINGIARSNALAVRAQTLIARGQVAQARVLEQSQHVPLIQTLITTTTRLRALEDQEAIAAAAQVRGESSTATQLVLALTALAVPLSALLALLLTRSLTRPLAALLRATRALAAGDLEASPHVKAGDEIGQVAEAFDAMRSNLRTTIAALALERQQTQAIIDASADGLILVDGHYHVAQMNPAAEKLTGWPSADAIGRHCWTVCGCRAETEACPTRPARVEPAAAEAEDGRRESAWCGGPDGAGTPDQPQTCPICPRIMMMEAGEKGVAQEQLIHLRSGQERWLAVSCAPIPGGAGAAERRLVVSLHDISQLKALDQLKSDFVAMVSHELRAPVTTVGGAVEMLGQIDPATDGGAYREVLGILDQQTRRLRAVVDEVLQVTRLEAGRLPVRLQPLELVAFLRALLGRVRQEWSGDERPLRLPECDEVVVWADPAMLEIVVRNLLDNARKYTPPGSPLEVDVRPDAASGHVQVCLSDHGTGIPADQLDRIFERFSRGSHAASEWRRGYGLGLYIARELLRAHNGEIRAENYAGGARFIFTLCTAEASATAEPVGGGAGRRNEGTVR